MLSHILIYVGAFLIIFWGVAHLIPTKEVVQSFGSISADNKRILTMEWINEGVTLIFVGALVIGTNYLGSPQDLLTAWVNIISIFLLVTMAFISLLTGARINFLPYRLCPVIFLFSGALILVGMFVG